MSYLLFIIICIAIAIICTKWSDADSKKYREKCTPSVFPDGFTRTRQWNRWHFDDTHQKICVLLPNHKSTMTFAFSQIKDVSVINDIVTQQNGSPVGRAIVGGILAGGIGAIIGAGSGLSGSEVCKSLKIRVTLFDGEFVDEDFITQPSKTSSRLYNLSCTLCNSLYSILSQAYYTGHPDIPNPVEETHIDLTQETALPDGTSTNQ